MGGEVGASVAALSISSQRRFRAQHPGTAIELSEVAGPKGKMFKLIREASVGWNGTDPVRPVPGFADTVMSRRRCRAVYLLETPLDPRKVADILAGEQSSGTFVRVAGETDDLRARSRATVSIASKSSRRSTGPSLPNALFERQRIGRAMAACARHRRVSARQYRANLPTLAATRRRQSLRPRRNHRRAVETRRAAGGLIARASSARCMASTARAQLTGVHGRPLIGTIIKPNVGLSAEATGALVARALRRPASTSSRMTRSAATRRTRRSTSASRP